MRYEMIHLKPLTGNSYGEKSCVEWNFDFLFSLPLYLNLLQ